MSNLKRYLELENTSSEELNELQQDSTKKYFDVQKKKKKLLSEPFKYFYKDIVGTAIGYELEPKISAEYKAIDNHAKACLKLVSCFLYLPLDDTLYSWIQRAIKLTDHFALHYIQEVKIVTPLKKIRNAGIERSRYRQISDFNDIASVSGNNMDQLYEVRSSLEHRTNIDTTTGQQEIIIPNYKIARNKIKKLYPTALKGFRNAYYKHT